MLAMPTLACYTTTFTSHIPLIQSCTSIHLAAMHICINFFTAMPTPPRLLPCMLAHSPLYFYTAIPPCLHTLPTLLPCMHLSLFCHAHTPSHHAHTPSHHAHTLLWSSSHTLCPLTHAHIHMEDETWHQSSWHGHISRSSLCLHQGWLADRPPIIKEVSYLAPLTLKKLLRMKMCRLAYSENDRNTSSYCKLINLLVSFLSSVSASLLSFKSLNTLTILYEVGKGSILFSHSESIFSTRELIVLFSEFMTSNSFRSRSRSIPISLHATQFLRVRYKL